MRVLCVTWCQSEVDRKQTVRQHGGPRRGHGDGIRGCHPDWPGGSLSRPSAAVEKVESWVHSELGAGRAGAWDRKGARSWGVGKMEDFSVGLNAKDGEDGSRWTGVSSGSRAGTALGALSSWAGQRGEACEGTWEPWFGRWGCSRSRHYPGPEHSRAGRRKPWRCGGCEVTWAGVVAAVLSGNRVWKCHREQGRHRPAS